MRERAEALHETINRKLIGTFKGKIEERSIKVEKNIGIEFNNSTIQYRIEYFRYTNYYLYTN